jgi:hypothetical protein
VSDRLEVHLWDLDSGRLVNSYSVPGDEFIRAFVDDRANCIHVRCLVRGFCHGPEPTSSHERLYDAETGKELTRLTSAVSATDAYWEFSGDGRTAAVAGRDDHWRWSVSVHDVASGQQLCTFADCDSPRLAPDGRLLGCRGGHNQLMVFDIPTGRQVLTLDSTSVRPGSYVKQITPDGKALLDSAGGVWDIQRGLCRFIATPVSQDCTLLCPDGRTLLTVHGAASESWLAYYDIGTGEELIDRRVSIMSFPPGLTRCPDHHVGPANRDGSLVSVRVSTAPTRAPRLLIWLEKTPLGKHIFGQDLKEATIVIEAATGRELMRGPPEICAVSADRRFAVVRNDAEHAVEIWDVPPRRPLRWLLPALAGWTVALLGLRWFVRFIRSRWWPISRLPKAHILPTR